MPNKSSTPAAAPVDTRTAWAMVLGLVSAFAVSQAFRTAPTIMAPSLSQAFGLSPQQLGLFAAAFHFSFAGLQLFMGMAIDMFGPRRTIVVAYPLTVLGGLVMATAPNYGVLVLGQILTGVGCGPAFLVCAVIIARSFPGERFAAVNGIAVGVGSVGLLVSGTPLAWVIDTTSWRHGFVALSALAALAWLAIFIIVRGSTANPEPRKIDVRAALREYAGLLRLPHTIGIFVLALTTYSAFMTLRGLWLGPLMIERHGLTLLQAGNVALALSVVGLFGAPLFGRLDPGNARRRRWMIACGFVSASLFVAMALGLGMATDVALALGISLMAGSTMLQYADVRASYPPHMTGRALAVLTMAMFLGVAVMQWFTGGVASTAHAFGVETYAAVLGAIAASLVLGAVAFGLMPAAPRKA